MKKMNSKGFTLIELLAVITIMGILMMVAIPAISKTIENSRRDTFANVAHEYINTVRNAVLADNLVCVNDAGNKVVASATADGVYYFKINSQSTNTTDLLEQGGKSSWGNAEVSGYVVWNKNSGTNKSATYYITLTDSAKHGIKELTLETEVKRAVVDPSLDTTNWTSDNKDVVAISSIEIPTKPDSTEKIVDVSSAKPCTIN